MAEETSQVDVDAPAALVEEAIRTALLCDALDREPPAPALDSELPTPEEFYGGEPPVWTPDHGSASDA